MKSIKKHMPWILRTVIFIMFITSGISKMFPIWLWEKQLVDIGFVNWCNAHYLARIIIASEIALGFCFLQKNFLRTIIIPVTILLLLAFNVHLGIEIITKGASAGNCGCFGQVIPMSPLEAFIKNVITIGLLIYLFTLIKEKTFQIHKLAGPLAIYATSLLLLFTIFPFCPCQNNSTIASIENEDSTINGNPSTFNSKLYSYMKALNVDISSGKYIICMFAPGCEHCYEVANEICELSKKAHLPNVYVLFMNEETFKIGDFILKNSCISKYNIINAADFWTLLEYRDTPGVFLIDNGKIIKQYDGAGNNKFSASSLEDAVSTF